MRKPEVKNLSIKGLTAKPEKIEYKIHNVPSKDSLLNQTRFNTKSTKAPD